MILILTGLARFVLQGVGVASHASPSRDPLSEAE
jgi:hypothetical protein